MAKSSKKAKETVTAENTTSGSMAEGSSDTIAATGAQPAARVAAKKAPKTARKTSATGAKKQSAAKPRAGALTASQPEPAEVAVSDDEIRLRAYFLAEKRAQSGESGDSASDWLEARRQLLAEAATHG